MQLCARKSSSPHFARSLAEVAGRGLICHVPVGMRNPLSKWFLPIILAEERAQREPPQYNPKGSAKGKQGKRAKNPKNPGKTEQPQTSSECQAQGRERGRRRERGRGPAVPARMRDPHTRMYYAY